MTNGDSYTLMQTKLQIPQIRGELVPRPRLLDTLNEGIEAHDHPDEIQVFNRKVTLVAAPAGYGRTTLIASWLMETSRPATWISLDDTDDSLSVFVQYIVAAVRRLHPDSCASSAQFAREVGASWSDKVAAELVNDIVHISDPFILALDDFHLIHDEAVFNLVSRLIEHQPPNLHIVISTRTDPLLPLHRLRASGEITEMRTHDLRFQDDEAETFLRRSLGLSIDRQAIAALNQRTEGWVVGLRLASSSIRGQKDLLALLDLFEDQPNTYVNEYLVSEVLAQQPEAIRAFMLQTSILTRLCGSLCEAVAGIEDPEFIGQDYLEWLDASNLFVISLDEGRDWFRYHHMFQGLLLSKLRAEYSVGAIQDLHCRASQWYSDQGFVEEALRHALAGNDVDRAIVLVEE